MRRARFSDIDRIVKLLERFHAQADQWQDFVRKDTERFIRNMMPNGTVLVSDGGVICGFVTSSPVNSQWLIAMELYWYAEDGSGERLLQGFEQAAREQGANEIRMSHRASTGKVGRHLEKRGYRHDETVYARIL